MMAKWGKVGLIAVGILLGAAAGTAVYALSPTNLCIHDQARTLIAGAYRDLPDRAYDSARVICWQNGNLPPKLPTVGSEGS